MSHASAPPAAPRRSEVEKIKEASRQLRGEIARTLADSEKTHFAEEDAQLLKIHGVYQQYDRDTATERKKAKKEKDHQFMARLRIPGGRLTADQYLAFDRLADTLSNGSLRLTTRQTIQYHGVLKGNLKALMVGIHDALSTTFGACGDVVRNVTAAPSPTRTPVGETIDRLAREISDRFLPRSTAYAEIWIDGERQPDPVLPDPVLVDEPLYGDVYLPRKFKIGVATPDDNAIDALTNDLAVIALFDEEKRFIGANLAVGGGLGVTHNKSETYPRLATPLLFVEPEGLFAAIEAIIKVQRDNGDRSNRKHARVKYVIQEKGEAWFKAETERYAGRSYDPPRPTPPFKVVDLAGWGFQGEETPGDRRWFLGVPVSCGRIVDSGALRLRSGLREAISRFRLNVIFTASQDIVLTDIAEADRAAVEQLLRRSGAPFASDMAPLQRWAMACPALPTCGLALTEAERARDFLTNAVLERLTANGLQNERISLRITGCPNGCARPYAGEIGLVGRMPDHYALYVGGDFEGTRLSFRLIDRMHQSEIGARLDPLFRTFAAQRLGSESFGDFCNRLGAEALTALC